MSDERRAVRHQAPSYTVHRVSRRERDGTVITVSPSRPTFLEAVEALDSVPEAEDSPRVHRRG